MRSGRSEFRLGARPRLLDGLGDVGCLAGGLAVVDGHFANSLRRSEHGLTHRGAPTANRDQRPVHVTLDFVGRGVDRLFDHFDGTEKLILRERLVEVREAAKKRPSRREQPLVRRAEPLAKFDPRMRAFCRERRDVEAAHGHRVLDRPVVEFVGCHRHRIGNLHRKVSRVDVTGGPQLSRELVIDVDLLHQLEKFAEEDAEHRPLRAVSRPGLAGLLGTKRLKDGHDFRELHARSRRFRCGRFESLCSGLYGSLFCRLFRGLVRGLVRRLFRGHVVLPNSRLQINNHFALSLILAEWASPVFKEICWKSSLRTSR